MPSGFSLTIEICSPILTILNPRLSNVFMTFLLGHLWGTSSHGHFCNKGFYNLLGFKNLHREGFHVKFDS